MRVGRNQLALATVAVGFAVLQLSTMGLRLVFGYDETIYLSQLNPALPAFPWSGHRAWGIPVLAVPVTLTDAPVPVVRLYLVTISSLGLYLAYRPWLAVRDTGAVPLAGALFASTYVAIYHSVMALPNYYVALGVVAAAGLFLGCRRDAGSRWAPVWLTVAVGTTALVRPSDSLWLVAPLALAWLGWPAWRRPAVGVAIGTGLLAGWMPWLVEAFARFGGPWARFADASDAVGGGGLHLDLATVKLYARMWSAARLECYVGSGEPCALAEPISRITVLWLFGAAVAVLVGVAAAIRAGRPAEGVLPLVVGASLAFSYFFLLRYGALRFLLPAGAVLALPAAGGVLALGQLRPPSARAVAAALAAAAVLAHGGLHLVTADRLGETSYRARSSHPVVVKRVQELGVTPPCLLFGDGNMVAYELGCGYRRRPRGSPAEQPAWIAPTQAQGTRVAALLRSAPKESFLDRWQAVPIDIPGSRRWTVYLPPAVQGPEGG